MTSSRPDGVVLYYLATPLFGVADLAFHAPLRVAAVLPPDARVLYYATVFALGLLCLARAGAAPWVGMLESSGNLLILLLAILLPIWNLPDLVLQGAPVPADFSGWGVVNAVLSGWALTASFHRHRERAGGGLRPGA